MKIAIENYDVECFETEQELTNYLITHRDDDHIMSNVIYQGKIYGIPENIKKLFSIPLLVQIKKQVFTDVQAVIILKK